MKPLKKAEHGFTLVEMLVVLAIVGILAAALYAASSRGISKTQLRDAAVQLLSDLRTARSQAQRTSQDSSVTLVSTSLSSPNAQYRTLWGTGTPTPVNRTLSNSVRVAPYTVAPVSSSGIINYTAPYGEVSNGIVWEVSSTNIPDKIYIKAVGVTGKAVLSDSPN